MEDGPVQARIIQCRQLFELKSPRSGSSQDLRSPASAPIEQPPSLEVFLFSPPASPLTTPIASNVNCDSRAPEGVRFDCSTACIVEWIADPLAGANLDGQGIPLWKTYCRPVQMRDFESAFASGSVHSCAAFLESVTEANKSSRPLHEFPSVRVSIGTQTDT